MSKTTVHTKQHRIAGHPFHFLPKVGMAIDSITAYPTMHERYGNNGFTVLNSIVVDDGVVQVVGDADNGHYEWVWFRENGTVEFTRSGWGSLGYALHDALNHAYART